MSQPIYYYLHTNGQLIPRNPTVVDSDPDYFNSPFVKRFWFVNDRLSSWRMVLEALALGANIERVKELAEKWKFDLEDSGEFLARYNLDKLTDELRQGMSIFITKILEMDEEAYWQKIKDWAQVKVAEGYHDN